MVCSFVFDLFDWDGRTDCGISYDVFMRFANPLVLA